MNICLAENEIALMQEYRTRLTADIVTGKLDVREAAAKLPEEVEEEPAPLGLWRVIAFPPLIPILRP